MNSILIASFFFSAMLYHTSGFIHHAISYRKSPIVRTLFMKMREESPRLKTLAKLYKPKSKNQRDYVAHLSTDETKIVIAVGPAGTGKTLFACNQAVDQLRKGVIEKVIITRPLVSVEEEIGFLPGNLIMNHRLPIERKAEA